jgi:hypothetical protein
MKPLALIGQARRNLRRLPGVVLDQPDPSMMEKTVATTQCHGASTLPSVNVESYNVELEDDEGMIGDRASQTAFRKLLEEWREVLPKCNQDPFGDRSSQDISKRQLDTSLLDGNPEAAGIIQGAVEDLPENSLG